MDSSNRKLLIFLLIVVLIFIGLVILKVIKPKEEDDIKLPNTKPTIKEISKFAESGYSEEEEKLIVQNLLDEQVNLVLENKYDKDILLSLIKEKYFINNNLDRYISYYDKNKEETYSEIIKDVNSNIDIEFYQNQVSSDTSKGILMIANKHYALDKDFNGVDVVDMSSKYSYYNTIYKLNKEAYEHFEKMWSDANKEGLDFAVYSAYRSYNTQQNLYTGYVNQDGQSAADIYSARPGNSEHQLGLAVDLKSRTMNTDYFEKTNEYDWLIENAYKYGFIERYKLGEEYITGYQYEPWHFRYCGVECATYIHENNITFEEYYEYFVKDK